MAKLSVPKDPEALKPIIESMIFASEEPLGVRTLLRLLFDTKSPSKNAEKLNESVEGEGEMDVEADQEEESTQNTQEKIGQAALRNIIEELNTEYESSERSFRIVEIAGGFQFATTRAYGEYVGLLTKDKARRRLSPAALETLAIVAYRQPVTKPEVEGVRGVNCDQVLLSLLEKNLIIISGRAESVGRPLLYSTSEDFLKSFGLNSLSDMPKLREIEELMEEDVIVPKGHEIHLDGEESVGDEGDPSTANEDGESEVQHVDQNGVIVDSETVEEVDGDVHLSVEIDEAHEDDAVEGVHAGMEIVEMHGDASVDEIASVEDVTEGQTIADRIEGGDEEPELVQAAGDEGER